MNSTHNLSPKLHGKMKFSIFTFSLTPALDLLRSAHDPTAIPTHKKTPSWLSILS